MRDEVRPPRRDLGDQRVHRPHVRQARRRAGRDTAGRPARSRRTAGNIWSLPSPSLRYGPMRRLKFGLDPLISKKRDHRTIQVSSSGMLTGSFAEVFSRVLLRSWVDRSLMTYSGRTMAWPKRNAPCENSSGICQSSAPRCEPRMPLAASGRSMKFGVGPAIGRVDRRMHHPPHQVLAEDVVIDQRQRVARAQEALVGGAKAGVRTGRWVRRGERCRSGRCAAARTARSAAT